MNGRLAGNRNPLPGEPLITVTTINGGTKVNTVPDKCEIMIDRRLVPGETKESCIRQLEDIINRLRLDDKTFDCSYEVTTFCPPGQIGEEEAIVNGLKQEIGNVLKIKPVIKGFEATCEASLVIEKAGIPSVIFGPGSIAEAHNVNEFIEIKQLVKASEIFANLFVGMLKVEQWW